MKILSITPDPAVPAHARVRVDAYAHAAASVPATITAAQLPAFLRAWAATVDQADADTLAAQRAGPPKPPDLSHLTPLVGSVVARHARTTPARGSTP